MADKRYDDSSISQLKGAERVRLRPEALLGSRGIDGAIHTIQEIIGNATDEKLAGYGEEIDIAYREDRSIVVRDYGRGVPLGWNEKENAWNYNLIYNELYAGGKYSDNQQVLKTIDEKDGWGSFKMEDYPYLISIGLNGLGAACAQYTSDYFRVISYRDGVASQMDFRKGVPVLDELKTFKTDEPNGTYIEWKPDDEVFSDTDIPDKWFENTAKALAFVTGFKVNLDIRNDVRTFEKSSIGEEMVNSVKDAVYTHSFKHIVDGVGDICICDLEVAIGPSGRGTDYYHNKVKVKGGAHAHGINQAMADFFYQIGRENGVKISERDYSGKLSVILSTLANKASLRNQTKDSIDDSWIATFIGDTVLGLLNIEHSKGNAWLEGIIAEVVQNAQNRIAVAEMSKNLKEVQKATNRHKASNKFITCRSYEEKGREAETELLIVEGDSAGGNVMQARDSNYQCLLKIRGKSLNVYKAPIQKLIANKEILDLISVLGCGIDLGIDEFETFDINKLRVGKIIFATDADVDGAHIRVLLFLIIYRLFPKLLSSGNIYVAETPLYVLNMKNNESIYCMTEAEMREKSAKLGNQIRTIDRFKGLGECTTSVLWSTMLNPETRMLRQIKLDPNDTDIYSALEVLFGKSTADRKKAILGSMLGTDFDETVGSIEDISTYIDSLDLNGNLDVRDIEY